MEVQFSIPRNKFANLVNELAQDYHPLGSVSGQYYWQDAALLALQESSELILVTTFEMMYGR
jgi:hypothetical protein